MCWIVEQAGLQPLSAQDTRLLMVRARAAKEALSEADDTVIDAVLSSGEIVHLPLSAQQFEAMTAHLVQKTLAPVRKALRDAGVGADEVKGVVLVGGATRMPAIRKAVGEFGRTPLTNGSGQGGRAGCRHAGQPAGRQRRAGRGLAPARCDPAVAGVETMGGGREDHPAQQHHPGGACPRIHHLQGWPDRDGRPCAAGRARTGG